jgi:hypothetical protein
MGGIAAIALCAAFTSCSKNNDIYDQNAVQQMEEQKKQEIINKNIETAKANYAAAFEKSFGKVGSNVDWGFGSKAATRTIHKRDPQQGFDYENEPAAITEKEAEYVTKWFQENPGLSEQGRNWKNFYVQFVSGDQTNKKGIWHRHDINPQPEGRDWDEEFTDNGGMDKLHIGAVRHQNDTEHVNDFNAKTGGPWDIVYITNGSALQWGYHSSWGTDASAPDGDGYYWYFKMADIEVPGTCFADGKPRVGTYVGLSLYGEKYDNGQKILGYQRLQYAEDWILKVTNADKPNYRVIAEDLNAEQASDFDFNDVVFDVVKAENNKTTLRLIACGGIYKLTVAGVEVHEKFGQQATDGKYPMINTGAKADINGLDPVEFEIDGTYDTPEKINNIEIRVWKPGTGDDGIVLTAEQGKAACKILVDDSFEVIQERQGIGDEQGLFSSYVQGGWDPVISGKWWLKK